MKNEEIIQELKSRKLSMSMCLDVESCRRSNNAIDVAISVINDSEKKEKEIEELKTEIIQLKARLEAEKVKKEFRNFCEEREE